MTVEQLIEKLREFPAHREVWIRGVPDHSVQWIAETQKRGTADTPVVMIR